MPFEIYQSLISFLLFKVLFYLFHAKKFYKKRSVPTLPTLKTGLKLRAPNDNLIFLFSTKTYVVGTQKNRLNETVLLNTQNIC